MNEIKLPLNGLHLKIIAVTSMVIDHACAIFFRGDPAALMVRNTAGRIAFPLFAFLLVEGFFHTSSRFRYARNLLVTAAITEILYDIAFRGTVWYPGNQNICFTLFGGLVMLCVLDLIYKKTGGMLTAQTSVLQIAVTAGFCLLFCFFRMDYSYTAGILFALFYYLYYQKQYIKMTVPVGVFTAVRYAANRPPGTLLALPFLLLYNGERGPVSKKLKWFFYIVYPLHLTVIFLILQIFTAR